MNAVLSILVALFLQACGEPTINPPPVTVTVVEETPSPTPMPSPTNECSPARKCVVIKRYHHGHFKVKCDF